MIANKRKLVLEDLEEFEQRSKRYWENRTEGDSVNRRVEVDAMDEDMEFELKEIMKREDMNDEAEDFTVTVIQTSNKEQETIEGAVSENEEKPAIAQMETETEERSQGVEEGEEGLDRSVDNENVDDEATDETKENVEEQD